MREIKRMNKTDCAAAVQFMQNNHPSRLSSIEIVESFLHCFNTWYDREVVQDAEKAPQERAINEKDIARIIGEAMGFASVCWDPKPTGVFDSTVCRQQLDLSVSAVMARLKHTAESESTKSADLLGARLDWTLKENFKLTERITELEAETTNSNKFAQDQENRIAELEYQLSLPKVPQTAEVREQNKRIIELQKDRIESLSQKYPDVVGDIATYLGVTVKKKFSLYVEDADGPIQLNIMNEERGTGRRLLGTKGSPDKEIIKKWSLSTLELQELISDLQHVLDLK